MFNGKNIFGNIMLLCGSMVFCILILPFICILNKSLFLWDKMYIFAFLIVFMLFLLFFSIIRHRKNLETTCKDDIILLVLISLLLRLLIVLFLGTNTSQISDYKYAFDQSTVPIPLNSEYYYVFTNWALYSEYLRILNTIFGINVINGIISNTIVSTICCVLIYNIIYIGTKNRRWAILSSLIFSFWPSNLNSIVLLTPEYLYMFFSLIALNLITNVISKKDIMTFNVKILFLIVAGLFLGISSFFKPIDKIIYIAIFMIIITLFLTKKIELVKYLKYFIIVLFSSFIITQVIYIHLDNYIGHNVNRNVSMFFLYVGLTPNGIGTWSPETAIYLDMAKENNWDYKKTDKLIKEKLLDEITNIKYNKLEFFLNKIKIAWGSEIYPSMVNATIDSDGPLKKDKWIEKIRSIGEIYYLLIWILFFISIFVSIKLNCNLNDLTYLLILYSFLLVFGFFCLLLLSEVQDRYKLVIYPNFSIISGYALERIFNKLDNFI
ncbi:dolichyl-phosphate-mannose-protein mannosyltransferase [Peptoanaerobacter stomatis]|uniref:Dolichyl-phosphate-mannose-protein mannosyltransferase n=1 Tax=Peptoanaerobacter stomatis TaxID=796937 RepID=J6HF80_9FIRM|nr:dolichyl-phosphate-mannose-protein mannosyltransferase [Peptoanaerobacter stomatis]NWO24568.1 hypothetical protein [Peptostreptococcaceae bacterium oral taxon 081]